MFSRIILAVAAVLALMASTDVRLPSARAAFAIFQTAGGPVCPDDDGSSGAMAGSPQYPTLLTGDFSISYTETIKTALGCRVAGVDYAVGLPSGTSLSDPTLGGLPAGCSYTSNVVTCSTGTTIQQWDFSLHGGIQLKTTGSGNFTITKNNFAVGASCQPLIGFGNTGNTTITFNTLDGGGSTCTTFAGGGSGITGNAPAATSPTITIEYNWIKNIPEDAIDFSGATGANSLATIVKFNLFDVQGWIGHPDGTQFNGGTFGNPVISHNTYRNYTFAGNNAGTQPFHVEAQSTSTISGAVVSFNTIVVAQSSNGTGPVCTGVSYPTNCAANYEIACKQDTGGNSNTSFSAYGNYVDSRGAIAALTNAYSCPSTTWGSPYSNWDMVANAALPTNP